jgi:hypothetical protein
MPDLVTSNVERSCVVCTGYLFNNGFTPAYGDSVKFQSTVVEITSVAEDVGTASQGWGPSVGVTAVGLAPVPPDDMCTTPATRWL